MTQETELLIEALGERADGIAVLDGKRVFVPLAVPGDRVIAHIAHDRGGRLMGHLLRVVAPGPSRTAAPCRHFGQCGGCALQHVEAGAYRDWKLERLRSALTHNGVAAEAIEPLLISPQRSRRRADLTALRRKEKLVLGFTARGSHEIVDLVDCMVLRPKLKALTDPLREVLSSLTKSGDAVEAKLTETDSGIDVLLVSTLRWTPAARARMIDFAAAQDLARVSLARPREAGAEVLVERRPVRMIFGDVPVSLPPGTFLQATAEGERALTDFVLAAAAGAREAADLFAGIGTFSLPLVQNGTNALAIDWARAPLAAVAGAARVAMLAGLKTEARDLGRRPLDRRVLERFDLVVFDPPRAGARRQAAEIARSRVATVVAVSCDPGTFARDARLLIDGGYRLERIRPVDQFLWSAHLELAAIFKR